MSLVRHVLEKKSCNAVWKVSPNDAVRVALSEMKNRDIGAVLVMDGDKLLGVFSERDLARKLANGGTVDLTAPVSNFMTSFVYFAEPDHTVDECLKLMISKHIRHLPVISSGKVVGVISINDLARESIADREVAIRSLETYVAGDRRFC